MLKLLATAASLSTGAPGGLFTPTLTFGALFGGLLGRGWSLFWNVPQPGAFAVIGAGAALAATTQGPVSAIVLMLELTHGLDTIMVPLMLAVAGATYVARRLEPR